jgi:hypothetical protein
VASLTRRRPDLHRENPAVDDPQAVSDAIGDCFDAVINASRMRWKPDSRADGLDRWRERTAQRSEDDDLEVR